MAKMVVIYRTPKDPAAFDRHYFEIHVPLAHKLPALRKYEVNASAVSVLQGNPDVYRIGILYFDDLTALQTAFASPEGRACAADRKLFAPDDSGFQMFLFDTREV